MDSTTYTQSSSTPVLGNEHPNYIGQHQTVSLRDVNDEESTSYPTHHQPLSLQGYNPATGNPQTPVQKSQKSQKPKKPKKPKNPQDPPKHGRGWTGNPRGRPPGSKNKPKGPDHGLPRLPGIRGRPPGAKNKNPRGAHNAYPHTPDSNSSAAESGGPQTPTSIMAEASLIMPPMTPMEAQTTYTGPIGYAETTRFPDTIDDDDRGYHEKTGEWYSKKAAASSSSSTSTYPEDIMIPMAIPYPSPPTSSYANQSGYGQPVYDHDLQYPPPPDPNQAFGNGSYPYPYNSSSSSSSSDPFASSSPDPRDMPAPLAPATSQADIAPPLDTGAQNNSPPPEPLEPCVDEPSSMFTDPETFLEELALENGIFDPALMEWDDFN